MASCNVINFLQGKTTNFWCKLFVWICHGRTCRYGIAHIYVRSLTQIGSDCYLFSHSMIHRHNCLCYFLKGGWDGNANFKIEFKSGGAIEFAEKLKHTAQQGNRILDLYKVCFLVNQIACTLGCFHE